MLPQYRKPKQGEIDICGKYLDNEIELINPKVLVPLDYYATKYILEKYAISLPSKSDFHTVYGKLFLAGDKKYILYNILPPFFIAPHLRKK
jgi:uracil-DNA glycosylase family 4